MVGALLAACGAPSERQSWENSFQGEGEDAFLLDDDFVCLGDERFENVEGRRMWNALGHQLEAVEHGRLRSLGEYPVGTVIQLFPDEASVKRGRGFSPATGDWEFLALSFDDDGRSIIHNRGTTEIANAAGSCISCHARANAFDYVCFTNDGCGSFPFFVDATVDPDADDPRCR